MSWYLTVLQKYAVFSGRARRKEYWMFYLFNVLIGFCLGVLSGLMGQGGESLVMPVAFLYTVAVFIPGLAVTVRRLHDTDHSGMWLLVAFIPFVGALVLLYFTLLEGDRGNNQYGPDPKDPVGSAPVRQPQRTNVPVS
jgi:uncharacterized membrane protein YhaH (DUF805 family)